MSPLAKTLKLNGYATAQFGKCHEVPVWETSPAGPFDAWPTGGGGFEYFYGFIGGEANQWYPTLYEGTTPVEVEEDARRGLPPHGGHDRQGDRLDRPAEGAHPRQAVLRLLRARRDPRAASRAEGMGRQVQGQVRRRAGTSCAKRPSPGRRSSASFPPDCQLTARHEEIPAWDDDAGGAQAGAAPRRWKSTPASWSTPTTTSAGCSTRSKKLGILDDTLVYYIIGDNGASAEGTLNGTYNEMINFNGAAALETPEFLIGADRQARRPGVLQPLRRRLGARDEHALPVDQAGRVALGRHAQRHDRALAEGHQGQGRDPLAVPPRHRRRADDPRSGRAARAALGERRRSRRRSKASACCTRSTTPRRPSGTRRSTSRCSATAASTTRAGPR